MVDGKPLTIFSSNRTQICGCQKRSAANRNGFILESSDVQKKETLIVKKDDDETNLHSEVIRHNYNWEYWQRAEHSKEPECTDVCLQTEYKKLAIGAHKEGMKK